MFNYVMLKTIFAKKLDSKEIEKYTVNARKIKHFSYLNVKRADVFERRCSIFTKQSLIDANNA